MKILLKALIFFINIIFPPCCLICGKTINNNICKDCEKRILELKRIKIDIKDDKNYFFEKHIYFFLYKEFI